MVQPSHGEDNEYKPELKDFIELWKKQNLTDEVSEGILKNLED